MKCLDFGDTDLIFKVAAVVKLKIHGGRGAGGGGASVLWILKIGMLSATVVIG